MFFISMLNNPIPPPTPITFLSTWDVLNLPSIHILALTNLFEATVSLPNNLSLVWGVGEWFVFSCLKIFSRY